MPPGSVGKEMKFIESPLAGVGYVETTAYCDERGSFYRAFCAQALGDWWGDRRVCQINVSNSGSTGTVRGFHFQKPPYAEMKLVRCLQGRVWDVVLDLRRNSRTFLKTFGLELSPENALMMVIPEGCAHAFQVLAPCQMLYLHSAPYEPSCEAAVRYDDPRLQLAWPLEIGPVSLRDLNPALLEPDFQGI